MHSRKPNSVYKSYDTSDSSFSQSTYLEDSSYCTVTSSNTLTTPEKKNLRDFHQMNQMWRKRDSSVEHRLSDELEK